METIFVHKKIVRQTAAGFPLQSFEFSTIDSLDAVFLELAAGLKAEALRGPTLLPSSILKKSGYLESFPQNLMGVCVFDATEYASIAAGLNAAPRGLVPQEFYLAPSACLTIYPLLEDFAFESKIVTTSSRVYRNEGGACDGHTRLNEFTMREIIIFGAESFVQATLHLLQEKTLALARAITLTARLAGAVDPFFPARKNLLKAKIQEANAVKTELLVPINGKDVALASFNFHGLHFTGPFKIGRPGTVSGCVGFGLERWMCAKASYGG